MRFFYFAAERINSKTLEYIEEKIIEKEIYHGVNKEQIQEIFTSVTGLSCLFEDEKEKGILKKLIEGWWK